MSKIFNFSISECKALKKVITETSVLKLTCSTARKKMTLILKNKTMAGLGNDSVGYVYVVKYLDLDNSRDGEQMFKVGTSQKPERRIDELLPGIKELVCQYYFEQDRFKVETFLKARLHTMKFLRVKGTTEYFYGDFEYAVGLLQVLYRDRDTLFPQNSIEDVEFQCKEYNPNQSTLNPEWCEICNKFCTTIHLKFGHKRK